MRIKTLLAGLVLGVATVVAAAEAQAQQLVRVAEVESVGGYTIFNDKTTVWAEIRGARISRGLIQTERRYRNAAAPLMIQGRLPAADTAALWSALHAAQPWRHARVHALSVNTDFPNTVVTYLGRFRQEIVANFIAPSAIPAGMPAVSRAMVRFLGLASNAVEATSDAPLFTYEAAGGRLGYRRTITITRGGKITDDVSFAVNLPGTTQPYTKDGSLTADEVNALLRLCADWSRYPAAFPGNPQAVDGIGVTTTLYRFGIAKQVFAGDPATRARSYQRILAEVERLASTVP